MRIRIEVDGRVAGARLLDTPAARDLAGMLPLTLPIERHGTTEWVAYPPRSLDTTGAGGGMTPEVGDIAYFAPWGNLAMYHAEGGVPSDGLVPLGRLDDDAVELLAGLEADATLTITAAP